MLLAYVSTSGARNSQDIREYSNLPRSLMLSHVFERHRHFADVAFDSKVDMVSSKEQVLAGPLAIKQRGL